MSEQNPGTHPGVRALAVTAFAIGVAEFIVVGVLPSIAEDLGVPLSRAGSLVGLYALALAIGTPIIVLALARLPRKPLLLGLVAVFLIGNLLSALSTSYAMLLFGRVVTAVAHGSFFAIGATVAARLAPQGQASRAIAAMFAGLNLAMVIGVPLGSLIGNSFGWRLPFFAVAVLAAIAWLANLRWVPALPEQPTGSARTQLAALARPAILAMMAITILGFGASFAAFYLRHADPDRHHRVLGTHGQPAAGGVRRGHPGRQHGRRALGCPPGLACCAAVDAGGLAAGAGGTGMGDAVQGRDGAAALRLGNAGLRHVAGIPGRDAGDRRALDASRGGFRLCAEHRRVQPGDHAGGNAGQRTRGAWPYGNDALGRCGAGIAGAGAALVAGAPLGRAGPPRWKGAAS
uniref:MFS transporter n=1 Tax=Thauera sp. SDU_THAU2 TaxID=3136633 RepID=UPI00311D643C